MTAFEPGFCLIFVKSKLRLVAEEVRLHDQRNVRL